MATISMFLTGLTLAASLFVGANAAAQATPAAPKAEVKADKPAQPEPATEKTVYVLMTTSMGDVTIELNNEKAPISTQNFLAYVDKKHYDGTIFHRVIKDFMIQGGGFTPDMKQKATEKPIANEWKNGLKNVRGSLAMARTSVPDSATSQFFINTVDNAFLDQPNGGAAYAVFGKVVSGMDVVDKVRAVKTTTTNFMQDVPAETVEIKSIRKLTADEASKLKDGGEKKEAPKDGKK